MILLLDITNDANNKAVIQYTFLLLFQAFLLGKSKFLSNR